MLLGTMIALALAAQSTATPKRPRPSAAQRIAQISRGSCEGTCPIYRVVVYSDGAVDYEGQDFVKVVGAVSDYLPPEDVAKLRQAFGDAGYMNLREKYVDGPSDCEFVDTFYQSGSRSRAIHHYACSDLAPKALSKLEARFEEIVRTYRWVGTPEERKQLRAAGWP